MRKFSHEHRTKNHDLGRFLDIDAPPVHLSQYVSAPSGVCSHQSIQSRITDCLYYSSTGNSNFEIFRHAKAQQLINLKAVEWEIELMAFRKWSIWISLPSKFCRRMEIFLLHIINITNSGTNAPRKSPQRAVAPAANFSLSPPYILSQTEGNCNIIKQIYTILHFWEDETTRYNRACCGVQWFRWERVHLVVLTNQIVWRNHCSALPRASILGTEHKKEITILIYKIANIENRKTYFSIVQDFWRVYNEKNHIHMYDNWYAKDWTFHHGMLLITLRCLK